MAPSIPIHTLVKPIDAEQGTNEKIRFLEWPLKINNVTSKLESQNVTSEAYNPTPKNMILQTTDPNKRVNLLSGKTVNVFLNPITLLLSNWFRKQW